MTGDVIDVVVTVNNTSTDTPASSYPDGVGPVPAKLTGAITVLLACTDPDCISQSPNKLKFIPVGGSGCVDKNSNTASCVPAGPDAVIVSLKSAGITIPGNGSVDVATIRIEVLDDNVSQLGLKAMTDPAALKACSSNASFVCAECDATGCTTLAFQPVPPPPAPCAPARIIFRGDAATPDFFEFHVLVPIAVINPLTETFSVSLGNAAIDPIFSFAVPLNQFAQQGGTLTFHDNAARDTGGIAFVKISPRVGAPGVYKIDIQAFDTALESAATLPEMTVRFAVGNDTFVSTNVWKQKQNGWVFHAQTP